jgi:alpha-beta hydrolase superfamily lysophospholipase
MVWLIGAIFGLIGVVAVWAVVIVLLQDVKIIPALLTERSENPVIPKAASEMSFPTDDGVVIDIWESAPPTQDGLCATPILFNHGNGHTNASFWSHQIRFRALGFHTYGYDYRGVAHSTGWPSERGIETDAAAILTMIAEKHGIAPSEVIVMGISLGSGPACYLAEKFKTRRLLLYTPYLSLPELVRSMPVVRALASFVWYTFPNRARLENWSTLANEPRELLVIHGRDDLVIPFSHSETIVSELEGRRVSGGSFLRAVRFIAPLSAAHDQVIEVTWEEVSTELRKWLAATASGPTATRSSPVCEN